MTRWYRPEPTPERIVVRVEWGTNHSTIETPDVEEAIQHLDRFRTETGGEK